MFKLTLFFFGFCFFSFNLFPFACCLSPESLSLILGPVALGLLQTLAGRFSLLCHLTGQHAASLTANLRRGRDVKGLVVLDHAGIFLDSYNECVFPVMKLSIWTFSLKQQTELYTLLLSGTAALWATSRWWEVSRPWPNPHCEHTQTHQSCMCYHFINIFDKMLWYTMIGGNKMSSL